MWLFPHPRSFIFVYTKACFIEPVGGINFIEIYFGFKESSFATTFMISGGWLSSVALTTR